MKRLGMGLVLLCIVSLVKAAALGAIPESLGVQQESLPALKDGRAAQTYNELWAGYDPQAEPLEVEILKEWEEDGVVLRILRYRIGIFKGQKAMMAAVYGYPRGGRAPPW